MTFAKKGTYGVPEFAGTEVNRRSGKLKGLMGTCRHFTNHIGRHRRPAHNITSTHPHFRFGKSQQLTITQVIRYVQIHPQLMCTCVASSNYKHPSTTHKNGHIHQQKTHLISIKKYQLRRRPKLSNLDPMCNLPSWISSTKIVHHDKPQK